MDLFVYGTLMAPAVWHKVVKGEYDSRPGRLHNYQRLCVAGASYPGLIASAGSAVDGVVYFDVSTSDMQRLDLFEGDEYERIMVEVELENGEKTSCQTFLFKEAFRRRLTNVEWSYEEFLKSGLQEFLETYAGRESD